ncbi:MAG TPA: GDSL-type esterase/lipase family protein, partial [Verrucomicrobiae bacterium]|nr:GDSL-type esterase/lipase family protein [Verrucomicrobiae bacterium]
MLIRHLVWLLIFAAGFTAHSVPLKVACVGDSITEGSGLANPSIESYPPRLQRLLGTNFVVRNYGVSGRTLLKNGDFPYWKEAFFKQSHDWLPDIVIIQLGTNDSKPQNWRYGTNFVADYEDLIHTYAIATNAPRILLCTPCPVYGAGNYDIRPGVVATNIVPLVHDLSGRLALDLIDLQTRLTNHSDWFPDTVHPNSKGMAAMAAIIFDELAGGPPKEDPPPVTLRRIPGTRVELSWPAHWAGLVPQSAGPLTATNTRWTIIDQAYPFNEGASLRLTNSAAGQPKFFRLWRPG